MPISKTAKKLILIISICLLSFIGYAGFWYYQNYYKVVLKHQLKRENEHKRVEDSFRKDPNIRDAGVLLDWYHSKKDYQKALYYGKECIRLGVNDSPIGYLINYQLAEIYNELGELDLARGHLTMALVLDKKKIILENNWLNKGGLSDVLSKEEIKSLVKG